MTIESKQYKPAVEVLQSLINLRDEMYNTKDEQVKDIYYKINSCLYAEYPYNWQVTK